MINFGGGVFIAYVVTFWAVCWNTATAHKEKTQQFQQYHEEITPTFIVPCHHTQGNKPYCTPDRKLRWGEYWTTSRETAECEWLAPLTDSYAPSPMSVTDAHWAVLRL